MLLTKPQTDLDQPQAITEQWQTRWQSGVNLVDSAPIDSIDPQILLSAINAVLADFPAGEIDRLVDFLRRCLTAGSDSYPILERLVQKASELANTDQRPLCSMRLLALGLEFASPHVKLSLQCALADSAAKAEQYTTAIQVAAAGYQHSQQFSTEEQVRASHQLLAIFMEAGEWQRIPEIAKTHEQLLLRFIQESPPVLLTGSVVLLSSYFLNYLQDCPQQLHLLRNEIGKLYTRQLSAIPHLPAPQTEQPDKKGKLRIGYIASTLRIHSVGWLSRWLFAHHDRTQFSIFLYHVNQRDDDAFNHHFFRDRVDAAYYFGADVKAIVQQIRRDDIDILVDLDSLALSTTYEVLCHKPAPLQVTWLGWDASGCPAIDYYIADPYVLPADAGEYYAAQIWRMPQTYLAVDGFESTVPTRRRVDYNLPADAIVYLCNQKSYKHHPDILRLQMQIVAAVPNSYLLVKLRSSQTALLESYREIAATVGFDLDRLRFLAADPHEASHRANLTLADVVLDTFPYNGATTTLETLWMNVPLVTKVGNAFVARNSYTFMINAGITEGIAWTDAEYVDWGIRLGTDPALRQQVRGKLLSSRKTSPLWNAGQFTQHLEQAYREMWQRSMKCCF